jgi:uncharacterized protein (DUF433 family)
MATQALAAIATVPIEKDRHGVFRMKGSRVTLSSVIASFKDGATAEEIVQQFSTLSLPDIYLVIGFYLSNRQQVESHLKAQHVKADRTRRKIERNQDISELRTRLAAKRKAKSKEAVYA